MWRWSRYLVDVRGVLERECVVDTELVSESVVLAVDHRRDEEEVEMGPFSCHESGDFPLSEFDMLLRLFLLPFFLTLPDVTSIDELHLLEGAPFDPLGIPSPTVACFKSSTNAHNPSLKPSAICFPVRSKTSWLFLLTPGAAPTGAFDVSITLSGRVGGLGSVSERRRVVGMPTDSPSASCKS